MKAVNVCLQINFEHIQYVLKLTSVLKLKKCNYKPDDRCDNKF